MEPTLHSWKGVLWRIKNSVSAYAHCPKHSGTQMDILYGSMRPISQDTPGYVQGSTTFVCPIDEETFKLDSDYPTLKRRLIAIIRSDSFKNAKIVDIDNIYTPILKVDPKPKDNRYSIQVEIDETPHGKKLVIYAADRENIAEKTQIFIDPQFDKISFDGRGDIHPNAIFSKVVAYFKDDKTATLKQGEE